MAAVIKAVGVTKRFGTCTAVDNISFEVEKGQILGIIGPNGAGKTTLLRSLVGLTQCEGVLEVLGMRPLAQRRRLMERLTFIADVATLPRWMKVKQAIAYVEGVHPRFDRSKAEHFLARTKIKVDQSVKSLSKGMVVQLHLALIMSIDAEILILDEPTIGLDIIYRNEFYQSLLNDYYTEDRTIIVTTHQVEEVEAILTDIMMINEGAIMLHDSMEAFSNRYFRVLAHPDKVDELRQMNPIYECLRFGKKQFIFEDRDRELLAPLGQLESVGIADVFVAKVKGEKV